MRSTLIQVYQKLIIYKRSLQSKSHHKTKTHKVLRVPIFFSTKHSDSNIKTTFSYKINNHFLHFPFTSDTNEIIMHRFCMKQKKTSRNTSVYESLMLVCTNITAYQTCISKNATASSFSGS